MTLPGMLVNARSMSYYERLQAVTANNLANVRSDGFKSDRVVGHRSGHGSYPVPVQSIDLSQGTLRDTGRVLDVALQGEGFLVVETGRGERLTRGGSLMLDGDGYLVDREGDRVLGLEGPIHASGREVVIEPDGTVVVDGARADRLRLETAPASSLRKEGFGRFVVEGETEPVESTIIRQRMIEDANVDPLLGMVDMITIQRHYAANTDALRTLDQALGIVTGELGRP